MIANYNPAAWFWIVGNDETQVYSSARASTVAIGDKAYKAWLAQGNVPTRIASMDELRDVLQAAQVPPYVSATPRQVRLALSEAGLLQTVEAAVEAAGGSTKITWEYALTINRSDPMIAQVSAGIGLTDQQIDALFARAAAL